MTFRADRSRINYLVNDLPVADSETNRYITPSDIAVIPATGEVVVNGRARTSAESPGSFRGPNVYWVRIYKYSNGSLALVLPSDHKFETRNFENLVRVSEVLTPEEMK